jgi:hypothetical protein
MNTTIAGAETVERSKEDSRINETTISNEESSQEVKPIEADDQSCRSS